MARRIRKTFFWIPPDRNNGWSLTINGVDVSERVLPATRLSFGLLTEDLTCEIILENSDDSLNGLFSENDIIVFKHDYTDTSTIQFEGEVEDVDDDFSRLDGNFSLKILGSHYTTRAVDIMVTEEYSNSTISDIRKDLMGKYLPTYTTNNVETNTKTISIKFVKKPLLDCLIDLDIQGVEDSFIDNNKDLNSFVRGSKVNDNEALVLNDSIFDIRGFGIDNTKKKNKVQIIGDAGGTPVLFTSEVSSDRVRERIVTDNTVDDEAIAETLVDSELDRFNNPEKEGVTNGIMSPNMIPGYYTYIIVPNKVHDRYRVSRFTFMPYSNQMDTEISSKQTIGTIIKDRILKDINQESIVNPNNMTHSFNFKFDNFNKIDSPASSNILISDGKLRWDGTGESGIMISNKLDTNINVSNAELRLVGEVLDGATYSFQANSQSEFQDIVSDTETNVDSSNVGKELKLKIIISNANTRIDSSAILFK